MIKYAVEDRYPLLTHKPIYLQEEQPEIRKGKELVLVHEQIAVKQLPQEELSPCVHVLELDLEDQAVVVGGFVISGQLQINVLLFKPFNGKPRGGNYS